MAVWTVIMSVCLYLTTCSGVKVVQPYRVHSDDGSVYLSCLLQPRPPWMLRPHVDSGHSPQALRDPTEVRVSVLKGLHSSEEMCSFHLILDQQDREPTQQGQVQCHASLAEGGVGLTVSGLRPNDTDMYRCVVETVYPPPYRRAVGNGTLVHVVEHSQCSVSEAQRQHRPEEVHSDGQEVVSDWSATAAPVSFPVVVMGTLVGLVLFLILSLQVLQWRQGGRMMELNTCA